MNRDDVRQWARNHLAVAERERQEARENPLSAEQAFASALALLVYDETLNGSPFTRRDPVSIRENEEVRQAWAKLRERWPHGR